MLLPVTICLAGLCVVLALLLFRVQGLLSRIQKQRQTYLNVQNVFSQAVAGMEASLQHEKVNSSRLLRVLDSIHDGVAIMDEDGNLIYANTALWKLYQIEPSERRKYMNESWIKLHSPKGQDEINAMVMPALEENNVWLGESDVLTQKGEMIRAELYVAKSYAGYIGFIRNVSSRYEAELENRRLSVQLHELKKYEAIERTVRAIVHEFSNSLSAVTGLSDLLADEVDKNSDTYIYAQKICASGLQMQYSLDKARALLPNAYRPAAPGFQGAIGIDLPGLPGKPTTPEAGVFSFRKI